MLLSQEDLVGLVVPGAHSGSHCPNFGTAALAKLMLLGSEKRLACSEPESFGRLGVPDRPIKSSQGCVQAGRFPLGRRLALVA